MRRALLVLAVIIGGAASRASAQQHVQLQASLDSLTPGVVDFHVANLLDDPLWRGALDQEVAVQLHWTVQLWRKRGLGAQQGPKGVWNEVIQHVTVTQLYALTEIYTNGITRERVTADSLRARLDGWYDVSALKPTGPGDWYFTVDLQISTLSGADLDRILQRDPTASGASRNALERLLLGNGMVTMPLHAQTATFTVKPQ